MQEKPIEKKKDEQKRCMYGVWRKGLKSYVGFCWCDTHKGYITKEQMKHHDCLNKKCSFFQKLPDSPYWKKKEEKKNAKRDKKAEERACEAKQAMILAMARGWSDQHTFMDFTSARCPSPGLITLTYFTKWTVDLTRCVDYLGRVWHSKVELRRIAPDSDTIHRILQAKKGRLAV